MDAGAGLQGGGERRQRRVVVECEAHRVGHAIEEQQDAVAAVDL